MKKKIILFLGVVLIFIGFAFYLTGCATIVKGKNSNLVLTSEPKGADVYVNGFHKGKTPVTLKLESENSYTIEFRKEGYETQSVFISNKIGVGYVVLDVLLGLVPVIIDAATGSWYELDQENINIILEQQQQNTDIFELYEKKYRFQAQNQ